MIASAWSPQGGKAPIVFLFSGQGSHRRGMATQLRQQDDAFRRAFEDVSLLLEPYLEGETLERLLDADDRGPFDRTLHTHAAIYAVQIALVAALAARGVEPDLVLGYSLGEYVALDVAGVLSRRDAAATVMAQARALEHHAPPAGMLAVLDNAGLVQTEPRLFRGTWVAAVNHGRHFVVAGEVPALDALGEALTVREITWQRLEVSRGFHSPLVDPAEGPFLQQVAGTRFAPARLPIWSSRSGAPLEAPDVAGLWSVCRAPVLFREAVRALEQQGRPLYVDLGPSGTLAGFVRALCGDPERCVATLNPWGRDVEALRRAEQRLAAR